MPEPAWIIGVDVPHRDRPRNQITREILCGAASQPSMRFFPVKSVEARAALMLAGQRGRAVRRLTAIPDSVA